MIKRIIKKLERAPLVGPVYVWLKKYYFRDRIWGTIKGNNNKIIYKVQSLKNVRFDIEGDNVEVNIAKSASLNNTVVYINGDNHKLIIGEHCVIKESNLYLAELSCSIVIGKKTTFEGVHLAAVESDVSIIIGEDCMFSHSIELRTGDSHSIIDARTGRRVNFPKNIRIGNHVWVGAYSKILKGVSVGDNSIIALGSIVTKNANSNSVYGGVPARLLKTDVNWLRERIKE